MKRLEKWGRYFLDFIFPQTVSILEIESMSSGVLLNKLPGAREIENDNLIVLFDYKDSLVREIIWELKYKGNRRIGEKLGEIIYDVLRQELAERAVFENFRNPLLIPMPISDKRRRERGWNQTEILGEALEKLDIENFFTYSPNILRKVIHTESQARTHATKREREENLFNSLKVESNKDIQGRCIILLDDVTTSGATLREARRALKESGVKKILCVAVAH